MKVSANSIWDWKKMRSFSGLGIGLNCVFGFVLMGMVAELCYRLWWKKRKLYSCNAEIQDVEMGEKKLGYGEEGVESELMRMHNLCGPSRFLFTIKEESREDLESEDGKSRTSNCKISNLWGGEVAAEEAEVGGLPSSPPPAFKFLRDAEDKFLMKEAERKRGLKNESVTVQESAIVDDFVKSSKSAVNL